MAFYKKNRIEKDFNNKFIFYKQIIKKMDELYENIKGKYLSLVKNDADSGEKIARFNNIGKELVKLCVEQSKILPD